MSPQSPELRAHIFVAFETCLDNEALRSLIIRSWGDVIGVIAYVELPAPPELVAGLEVARGACVPHIPGLKDGRVSVYDVGRHICGVRLPRDLVTLEPDVGSWLARRMVRDGLIAREDLPLIESAPRADRAAVEFGLATEAAVTACVARFHRLPRIDLASVSRSELSHMSFTLLAKLHVVTLGERDGSLVVAMDNPADVSTLRDLSFISGLPLSVHVASWSSIERLLNPPTRADGGCRFCERAGARGIYNGACEDCANQYLGVVF